MIGGPNIRNRRFADKKRDEQKKRFLPVSDPPLPRAPGKKYAVRATKPLTPTMHKIIQFLSKSYKHILKIRTHFLVKNHGVLLEDLLLEGTPLEKTLLEKTLLEGLLQEPILQEDIFRRAGGIFRRSLFSDEERDDINGPPNCGAGCPLGGSFSSACSCLSVFPSRRWSFFSDKGVSFGPSGSKFSWRKRLASDPFSGENIRTRFW